MTRRRTLAALVVAAALALTTPLLAGPAASADPGAGIQVEPQAGSQGGPTLQIIGGAQMPLETTTGIRDLAVSRDGKRAVAVSGDWLQVMSLTTDNPKILGTSTAVFGSRVVLSKNGKIAYVLSGRDTLFVVDVSGSGKPKKLKQLYRKKFSPSDVFDMEISPNGKYLYIKHGYVLGGYGQGKGIQVLSLKNPRKPKKAGHANTTEWHGDIGVSPNGKRMVTTSTTVDTYILLHKVKKNGTPKQVKRLRVPFDPGAIAISKDNKTAYVVSATSEDPLRVAKVNLKKNKLVSQKQVGGREDGTDIGISPDGKYLYVTMWRALPADNPSFLVLDAKTIKPRHEAWGEEFYAPQAVQVSGAGTTKGRIYVPTYTGIMGGQPLVVVFEYK